RGASPPAPSPARSSWGQTRPCAASGAPSRGSSRACRPRRPRAPVGVVSTGYAVPSADAGRERLGLGRSPAAAIVGMRGGHVPEDRVDDRPGGLDLVLAREERGIAGHRVAQETLVGV